MVHFYLRHQSEMIEVSHANLTFEGPGKDGHHLGVHGKRLMRQALLSPGATLLSVLYTSIIGSMREGDQVRRQVGEGC